MIVRAAIIEFIGVTSTTHDLGVAWRIGHAETSVKGDDG